MACLIISTIVLSLKLANLISAASVLFVACVSEGGEFLSGADFSHLAFFEDRGIIYKDAGQPQDACGILSRHGLNCVRLRLFTSSAAQAQADPYSYTNNLDYTLPLAVRAKNAGLQLLLNFHYSDTWADPGQQTKPAAWTDLTTFDALEQQMYDYNSNAIAAFKAARAMPEYVQVGNEIIGGMLWPDGRVGGSYDTSTQWSQLGRLIKAAIRGIKDAAGTNKPGIMIHIDRGGDWDGTRWFFDHLGQQQVEFDAIGQSYYPFSNAPAGPQEIEIRPRNKNKGCPLAGLCYFIHPFVETALTLPASGEDGRAITTSKTIPCSAGWSAVEKLADS